MASKKYAEMTKAELDEVARARNIEGRSSMSRDELEKALNKSLKGGTTSNVVTPRQDQGEERAVVYLEDGEERDLSGAGEVAPSEGGTADGGSLGGTITGPDTTTPTPGRTTTPPVDTTP
jgi:hypothetical protein